MKNANRLLALLSTLALLASCASPSPNAQVQGEGNGNPAQSSSVASAPFNYDDYAAVLETYVDENGLVDYKGLQANRQQLDAFNESIGRVSPSTYEAWNESEKIAFLINAYNAFTLQSIIDQEPLKKSIRDIIGVWKIRKFNVAGQNKTLDNIEHKTLRVNFNEPRIHAALVCAAISCPPLLNEPYTGETLDAQLDGRVNAWLSGQGLKIDREAGVVSVSAIFDWFGEDWEKSYGVEGKFTGNASERASLNFISNYVSLEDKAYLEGGDYQLKYLHYDWALNIQQ